MVPSCWRSDKAVQAHFVRHRISTWPSSLGFCPKYLFFPVYGSISTDICTPPTGLRLHVLSCWFRFVMVLIATPLAQQQRQSIVYMLNCWHLPLHDHEVAAVKQQMTRSFFFVRRTTVHRPTPAAEHRNSQRDCPRESHSAWYVGCSHLVFRVSCASFDVFDRCFLLELCYVQVVIRVALERYVAVLIAYCTRAVSFVRIICRIFVGLFHRPSILCLHFLFCSSFKTLALFGQ